MWNTQYMHFLVSMLCFHNPQQIEFNGDWNVGKVIHLFIVQFPNWEWNNRLFVLEDHQRVHFNLLFFLTLKDLFENERVHKHLLEILKKLNLLTILSSPNFCFEKRYFVQVLLIWFFCWQFHAMNFTFIYELVELVLFWINITKPFLFVDITFPLKQRESLWW